MSWFLPDLSPSHMYETLKFFARASRCAHQICQAIKALTPWKVNEPHHTKLALYREHQPRNLVDSWSLRSLPCYPTLSSDALLCTAAVFAALILLCNATLTFELSVPLFDVICICDIWEFYKKTPYLNTKAQDKNQLLLILSLSSFLNSIKLFFIFLKLAL